MTKLEVRYKLTRQIGDEKLMEAISRVSGVYGLGPARLSPGLDLLTVEFDASRLTEGEVEDYLRRFGLPIERLE